MFTLYHAPGSRSARVRWALEELGVDYQLHSVDREAGDLDAPEFRALNPLGRIPVLVDEVRGVTLFESGAIIEYLLETNPGSGLAAERGTSEWATGVQWMHAAETMAAPARWFLQHSMRLPEPERVPAVAASARAELVASLQALDDVLADQKWVCGARFSAADIMVGYLAIRLGGLGISDGLDNVIAYASRLQQRPACQVGFS